MKVRATIKKSASMKSNLILTWFGVILTFVGTAMAFAFSVTPMPPSDQLWFFGMCALVVFTLVATYAGRPRDLARPVTPAVRGLSLLVMALSGGAWLWFLVRTVGAADNGVWGVRIQRTLALFLFAGAYYLFTQKPRR